MPRGIIDKCQSSHRLYTQIYTITSPRNLLPKSMAESSQAVVLEPAHGAPWTPTTRVDSEVEIFKRRTCFHFIATHHCLKLSWRTALKGL
jgi:hypothetical protein